MNADESATDRPSAFICVHLRLTTEKLFLMQIPENILAKHLSHTKAKCP